MWYHYLKYITRAPKKIRMNGINSNSWSKYSDKYNGPSGKPLTLPMVQSGFEKQWFAKLEKNIKSNVKKGPLKLLLLACGTGAEVEVLCTKYTAKEMTILATDFASGMVEATQECVERMQKQDMVQTKVMNAMVRRDKISSRERDTQPTSSCLITCRTLKQAMKPLTSSFSFLDL